jgi:hypothetical protein
MMLFVSNRSEGMVFIPPYLVLPVLVANARGIVNMTTYLFMRLSGPLAAAFPRPSNRINSTSNGLLIFD